jgi:hypothetical protein
MAKYGKLILHNKALWVSFDYGNRSTHNFRTVRIHSKSKKVKMIFLSDDVGLKDRHRAVVLPCFMMVSVIVIYYLRGDLTPPDILIFLTNL